jgi:hypothetical protein
MNLDKILYRILLGYYHISIEEKQYKVLYPSMDIKYQAEILFDKIIEDNKFDKRLLTEKEIEIYLQTNEIWKPEDQKILDDSKKFLDEIKINLYLNYLNETSKIKIKKQIKSINQRINRLLVDKNSMNYLGIKEHATSIKNEFIIMNTIYDNTKLVFNNPEKDSHEHQKLQTFIREIVYQALDINILRDLVKSEIWRSYASCFNLQKDTYEINDDYRYLVGLHKMYENVRQHPECPSEEIIADDDALDGWFLYQNKKSEKEKKKNSILNKVGGNIKNAGEIFLMTNDANEAKEIFDLNDEESKRNIREIISTSQENKDSNIKWTDLGFVQKELQQKTQQIKDQQIKGKK